METIEILINNKELILLFFATGLEIYVRLKPTHKNYSLISHITKFIDFIIPNNQK